MADAAPLLPVSDTKDKRAEEGDADLAPWQTEEQEEQERQSDIVFQVERLSHWPLYQFHSLNQLVKVVFWGFFPEYLSLPIFYLLGTRKEMVISRALQALFLAGSSYFQLSGFGFLITQKERIDFQHKARVLLQPLESVMGMPVRFLGVRKWQFDFMSLAPNYLSIITTVQAIATVEDEWISYADVFRRRWENVALIGRYVGELGLPNILKISVVFNMACHFLGLMLAKMHSTGGVTTFPMLAESANFLLLEKATNTERGLHVVRTLAAPLVKVPMIWMKVSLLALLYDSLDSTSLRTILIAISLAFYGLVPILPGWASMTWEIISGKHGILYGLEGVGQKVKNSCILVPLLGFSILMAIVVVHFVGVFACDSHDLSVLHGCTDRFSISGNLTNQSGS